MRSKNVQTFGIAKFRVLDIHQQHVVHGALMLGHVRSVRHLDNKRFPLLFRLLNHTKTQIKTTK